MTASWNLDEPPVPAGTVRVRVVLVRHGQSEWNAQGRIQGHQGGGLTPTGREQARTAADLLCRAYPKPALVVSSDLPRAVETAQIYLENCDPSAAVSFRVDERLREVDNGAWSGRLSSEVAVAEAAYIARIRHGEDLSRGGGESLGKAQNRVRSFVTALAAELALRPDPSDRWAVAFGHGGTIRLAAVAALGLPGTASQLLGHASNTAISEIEYWVHPNGSTLKARLLEYNSAQHLSATADAAAWTYAAGAPAD